MTTKSDDPFRDAAEEYLGEYNQAAKWMNERRDELQSVLRRHFAEALEELETLRRTFAHTHVAARRGQAHPIPGYPDRCQECGLDIRNKIHSRAAIDAAREVGEGGDAVEG